MELSKQEVIYQSKHFQLFINCKCLFVFRVNQSHNSTSHHHNPSDIEHHHGQTEHRSNQEQHHRLITEDAEVPQSRSPTASPDDFDPVLPDQIFKCPNPYRHTALITIGTRSTDPEIKSKLILFVSRHNWLKNQLSVQVFSTVHQPQKVSNSP